MGQTSITHLSILAKTLVWSSMTRTMNGTFFGQATPQTTFSEKWTDTKNSTIFLEATTLEERIACTRTSHEWKDDMVMSIIYVLRPMCFHRICSSLIMIGRWRKIRTVFGFLNQLHRVVDEGLSCLPIMKSYQRKRKDFLFLNTSTHHFLSMDTNLIWEFTFLWLHSIL